jgi:Fe-S cluster assembly iron-binding protein IscA
MSTDFELAEEIDKLESDYGFELYVPKTDRQYLENAKITRVVVADHTGEEKVRYIFASDDVEDRCGCGTSFAFEKPAPKIDLVKLKLMRENFLKNKK